jgi:hypothetical protein
MAGLPEHAGVRLVLARTAGGVEPYSEEAFDHVELDGLAGATLGAGDGSAIPAIATATGG